MPSSPNPITIPKLNLQVPGVHTSSPVSKYAILKDIGRGRHGAVHQAQDIVTEKYVAIKIVSIGNEIKEKIMENEVSLLKRAQSKNVVCYVEDFKVNKDIWVVMEYCELGSVDALLNHRNKGLPEQYIIYIAHQVLQTLVHLHKQNVIHYDIKCTNLLVDNHGSIKLADFGEAYHEGTTDKSNCSMQRGSLPWMSPEVLCENNPNEKVDIWALGITCIEMAELSSPFSHLDEFKLRYQFQQNDCMKSLVLKPHWSDELQQFISRCLVKDPAIRPSAEALLSDPIFKRLSSNAPKDLVDLANQSHTAQKQRPVFEKPKTSFISPTKVLESKTISSNTFPGYLSLPTESFNQKKRAKHQFDERLQPKPITQKSSVKTPVSEARTAFLLQAFFWDSKHVFAGGETRWHSIPTASFRDKIKSDPHDKEKLTSQQPWH